jgi:transcriptional regulator with XRE-family HTH domain
VTLAVKLKELRVRSRKSLQQVADEVGASKAHIWDLETGKSRNPSIELLFNLARCFNVSVSDLIGENPGGENEQPELVAMYRELKELDEKDREAIKMIMQHLKERKRGDG